MIHTVRAINYRGEIVDMWLRNPEASGFLIFNMDGLGPGKSEIRLTDIITSDGGIYNSSRLPARNITMSVRFFASHGEEPITVEQLRHKSYKYFPIKKPVTLVITTDERVCEILGYVESNEPVIFSKETHMQISIICPYPFFYDANIGSNVTVFSGVTPLFEFPFENKSLTSKLLYMSKLNRIVEGIVEYTGDSNVGITITIDILNPIFNLTIHKIDTDEKMILDTSRLEQMTGQGITAGDRIIIVTVTGEKSATLLRNGVYTNILYIINRDADWFQLSKGENHFAFESLDDIEAYPLANAFITIENKILYEGV